MLIMAKSESNILNLEHIENIFIGSDRKSIKANMASRSGCELAKYETAEQTQFALGMLFSAMQSGDAVFQFPKEIDINFARQQNSNVTSRKKSHGGS